MSHNRKATDAQILEAYKRGGSVKKASILLGLNNASVHERLVKLGASNPPNFFSSEDKIYLMREYHIFANNGDLSELAKSLGRTKSFICRQARILGITNRRRKKAYLAEATSIRIKKFFAENGHPRGMLGKKHSLKTRETLAVASQRRWDEMTSSERGNHMLRARKARKSGPPNVIRGTWKAGWREFGGKRYFFRSRWEANYGRYLEWLKSRGEIVEWEHEPETFWFEGIKRGTLSFLPDFRVTERNGDIAYHEVKGWMDARSKTILRRMKKYHPMVRVILIDGTAYKAIQRTARAIVPGWETDR